MPHGIINSESEYKVPWQLIVGGSVWATYYDNTGLCGETKQPASTSNPLVFGRRAPNGWYNRRSRWQLSDSAIRYSYLSWPWIEECRGNLTSFGLGDSRTLCQLDPTLADDLLRKTLSQLVEDDVAFNAFLLQGKQSLKMVTNLATGLAHGTEDLMRTQFPKGPRQFKRLLARAGDRFVSEFSGRYLEFLYGWKPLADDVENAFSSMIDGYTGPEQKRFRITVRGHRARKGSITPDFTAGNWFGANWHWTQELATAHKAKLVLHYAFPSQAGETLPTLTPFGTAWELMPWSFVVDWFIPIGDWVGAMEATQFAIYMQDAVLTQSAQVSSRQGSPSRWTYRHPRSGYEIVNVAPPRLSGSDFYMTREVLSPVQVLDRIRFPSFSSKFGLPQASQALALLSQVLNKWF